MLFWSSLDNAKVAISCSFLLCKRCITSQIQPTSGPWAISTDSYSERSPFDPTFALALAKFLHAERASSVLDLGAGGGRYIDVLAAIGMDVLGVEGNKHIFQRQLSNEAADARIVGHTRQPQRSCSGGASYASMMFADLSNPLHLYRARDWVLALEVGEHIPRKHEGQFLQNIHNHNTVGAIISWAHRGQPGDGHVNCRYPHEVMYVFSSMGYVIDHDAQSALRNASSRYWFQNNVVVLRRYNDTVDFNKVDLNMHETLTAFVDTDVPTASSLLMMRWLVRMCLSSWCGEDRQKVLFPSGPTTAMIQRKQRIIIEHIVRVSHYRACYEGLILMSGCDYAECCRDPSAFHKDVGRFGDQRSFDECCTSLFKKWGSQGYREPPTFFKDLAIMLHNESCDEYSSCFAG